MHALALSTESYAQCKRISGMAFFGRRVTKIVYLVQELAERKKGLAMQEKEGVRLTQLLDIEKSSLAEAKEELHGLRLEIKDLIAQSARDSAQVAAAEDARRQWEAVQVPSSA
jgi:septal ring factor EnvC (AmiA/AmiB activator)